MLIDQAQGVGFTEAPRGGLAHWIVIEDGKIANYQAVVPSTWNAASKLIVCILRSIQLFPQST